jgi:hypothetical protein
VTTGREGVGSEASTRARRAAAAALASAAFLVGAAVAMADPGSPGTGSTTTAPPAPPPTSGGSSSPATTPGTPTPPTDSTPPPRARNLQVSAPKPGEIVLTWTLVNPSDVAHVFVMRKPAGHCPTIPVRTNPNQHIGTRIGSLDARSREVDTSERDKTRYCYAVFTLDAAGNWASPVTHLARNKGDTTPPVAVSDVTGVFGQGGAVRLTWTNPPDAAHDLVLRGPGVTCPQFTADGTPIGTRRLREAQVDFTAPSTGTSCYAVFAFDAAGNRSPIVTVPVAPAAAAPTTSTAAPPPNQSGSSGSLPDVVGIIGGGAIALAGLAFVTLRLVRREWEWHSRTGYGIRDLMSIDVSDYDRQALVLPAIIGV